MIQLFHGDCLEVMNEIPDQSVDLILTDPPYGTTACSWDAVISFEQMWKELKRLIRPNRAIVLFGQEPFSSFLRCSNIVQFKYDWYWRKSRPSGFVNAKLKPLKDIEVISVFSDGTTANGSKNNMMYNPQGVKEVSKKWSRPTNYIGSVGVSPSRQSHLLERTITAEGYPRQVLDFPNPNKEVFHPTQKPVALMEYLIRTYTKEGETVLDFTMGSGSTGVAAVNTNRSFIGIERDDRYFEIAKSRIEAAQNKSTLETFL
jgi:DNA modification methylase